MDLATVVVEGVKLNEMPDGAGIDSVQLTAQHKRVAFAAGDLSLLLALSQHFIILLFDAWRGVPDTTPPARAKSKQSNKSRFAIR